MSWYGPVSRVHPLVPNAWCQHSFVKEHPYCLEVEGRPLQKEQLQCCLESKVVFRHALNIYDLNLKILLLICVFAFETIGQIYCGLTRERRNFILACIVFPMVNNKTFG